MSNLEYLRQLGTGSYSTVWLAKDKGTGALRAVKLVSPNSIPDVHAYNAEARVLSEASHPHIVTVYGTELGPQSGNSPEVGRYAILMEYMEGGSLEDLLLAGKLLLAEATQRIIDACRGVERLHALGYLHGDIKPSNILTAADVTKLSDFGLVRPLNGVTGPAYGTPYYTAPELFNDGPSSQRSDVYSLAVTLYEVVNGREYFTWRGAPDEFRRAVSRGRFPDRSEFAPFIPPELQKVIRRALHVDPDKRYATAADFRHAVAAVPIRCSWIRESSAVEAWLGMGPQGLFRLLIDPCENSLEVSRCKTAPGAFRKVTSDCAKNAGLADLRRKQRSVMQRITANGR